MKLSCTLIIILMVITSWGQQAFSQERAGISMATSKRPGADSLKISTLGEAELKFLSRINRIQNPLLSRSRQSQFTFDLEPRLQLDVMASMGEKLKLNLNYTTASTFNFENQVKLTYTGTDDEIIRKVELGNVSFQFPGILIPGVADVLGIKTALQLGKLELTAVFGQQKSDRKQIQLHNGAQQQAFSFSADQYQANQHFFLADYFRSHYDEALSQAPLINSGILISKVEVWVTNKSGSTQDLRDVVAFLDLGEHQPYLPSLANGSASFSKLPAGFSSPRFPQQSNALLSNLPADARLASSQLLQIFFQPHPAPHFARLYGARMLNETEYTLHPQLGYISLNQALTGDEVLAVAFQYAIQGQEFQVGEFSSDVPADVQSPNVLFVKLLKPETFNPQLPTWRLMMKNIYGLGATLLHAQNFKLDILRLDEGTGTERFYSSEGEKKDKETNTALKGKRWLEVFRLDRLNENGLKLPDGLFDFQTKAYATIDQQHGRLIFPVLEPFGANLTKQFYPSELKLLNKYSFEILYDSSQVVVQQQYLRQSRYLIKGSYEADANADISLQEADLPEGSVHVLAGLVPLQEGIDFIVDYRAGLLKIINTVVMNSGQPITVTIDKEERNKVQLRSLFGTRFNYRFSDHLQVGGTYLRLRERSGREKAIYGEEPLSNRMWGLDLNYNRRIKAARVSFSAAFAQLIPGKVKVPAQSRDLDGSSYLDDFERSQSIIDLRTAGAWQLSATPQFFLESDRSDDLSYGFNRARLAFYQIDPDFYLGKAHIPASLSQNKQELSKHSVREVFEQEVFPFKDQVSSVQQRLSTFDLAFYPMVRGPYNLTSTGIHSDGSLSNPRSRWGGLFRRLDQHDFEALNVEYLEVWLMDPFMDKATAGGDLYINLGNVSEDILKDGRRFTENGLSELPDSDHVEETNWGRVPKLQPLITAFDKSSSIMKLQDVGLDGLPNLDEQRKFATVVRKIAGQVLPAVAQQIQQDPSSDDYRSYISAAHDVANAGILKRYEAYNGTEGNSGADGSTVFPDAEDVNRDQNMTQTDAYFQYRISMRPKDLVVGRNYVTDEVMQPVKLRNGKTQHVKWYQIRIPISAAEQRIGQISDFKSIRFIRLFMTDFADTTVLRFARLQLVKGDWRMYNARNHATELIHAPGTSPPVADQSTWSLASISIEENGKRSPIPYVLPPGLERELNDQQRSSGARLNEQSLTLTVHNLGDGYGRAAFKTAMHDFRSYQRLELDIHLEAADVAVLKDNDLSALIRIGADQQDNYYEYVQPLKATLPGTTDPYGIWPDQNKVSIDLSLFQAAKAARNDAKTEAGDVWPVNVPFEYKNGLHTIMVKGQPDLSNIRVYMLGVLNPLHHDDDTDDGQPKDGQLWFNELRLTGFDQHKGWSAAARLNLQLKDFGDLNISGQQSSIGFGSLTSGVGERAKAEFRLLELSSNMELGKLLPRKSGIRIPVYLSYSKERSTPQYDPLMPDVELQESLKGKDPAARKAVLKSSRESTVRKSLSINNVRKVREGSDQQAQLWDVENWSGSYAYSEYTQEGFTTGSAMQQSHHGIIAYQFSPVPGIDTQPREIGLLPTHLNFSVALDRLDAESAYHDAAHAGSLPSSTAMNNHFTTTRVYGITWNFIRDFMLDFNATNYAVVNEGGERMELLGQTTDYQHQLNISYQLPLQKIRWLSWLHVDARLGTTFSWQREPLTTLRDPAVDLGNTIQNSRTLQVNPGLNFEGLYSQFSLLKKQRTEDRVTGIGGFLIGLMTSLKTVNVAYTHTSGIFMPGYLPMTQYLGIDGTKSAPGFGFVFGSQHNISSTAMRHGWLAQDSMQSQLYVNSLRSDFNFTGTIVPFEGLKLTIMANKSRTLNTSASLTYNHQLHQFDVYNAGSNGDFSSTFLSIATAFVDRRQALTSQLYTKFMNNRQLISQRLGAQNPHSSGISNAYADGYQKTSQDVIIAAFIAAYSGKEAKHSSLSALPKIPLPNWRISYTGLHKIIFLQERFKSIDIHHMYNAVYRINGFNTLLKYTTSGGFVNSRDEQHNFLPAYQFAQVTIAEQFSPLLGLNTRLKNNLTTNMEIGRNRLLGLSLSNHQLAQLNEQTIILGMGFRNDKIDAKLDVAFRDQITVIYRADASTAEVTAGAQHITLRPAVNYLLNKKYNIKVFYDSNVTRPYTSQTFNTSYTNFGFSFKALFN